MNPIMSNALSGLQAASTRLGVSANNVANANSTVQNKDGQFTNIPYSPQTVAQQSIQQGGVKASVQDLNPPAVPFFDPESPVADENGVVQTPNVDFITETAEQLRATTAYKASLAVMRREDAMTESLLNISS